PAFASFGVPAQAEASAGAQCGFASNSRAREVQSNDHRRRARRGGRLAPSKTEGRMTVPRPRKPRPPVVVRPSFVSQDSAPALLGLSARKFLEVLVPKCAG